jgi:virginiamycin B lyase
MNSGVNMYRVDPKTMMADANVNATPKDQPAGPGMRHFVYQLVVDSKGNPWGSDFPQSQIVGVDAATGDVKRFPTLTKDAYPRRGRMDKQDRYWFGMYYGDRIGMLDTRAGQMKEWPAPRQYMTPYTSSAPDAKGRVYAPSNTAERLLQLDPSTGQIVEFQMPTDFDTKKIVQDPTTTRPVLWMANTRNARLLRVEPLNE